ncbi:Transcription factor, partial [Dipsacomyces acuminosporus]
NPNDGRKKTKHSTDPQATAVKTEELVPVAPAALGINAVHDAAAQNAAAESIALPAIGSAHTSIMAQQGAAMAVPVGVPLHTDRPASLPGIGMAHTFISESDSAAQNTALPPAVSMLSGSSSLGQICISPNAAGTSSADSAGIGAEPGAAGAGAGAAGTGVRRTFGSNPFLLFGNDAASNEFSALNEFLESLHRGIRGAERLAPDARLSHPSSGSSPGPPSNANTDSPSIEQFHQVAQPLAPAPAPSLPSAGTLQQQQRHASVLGASTSGIQSAIGSHDQQQQQQQQSLITGHQTRTQSLPTITQLMTNNAGEGVTQTERFLLTAADPNDGTSEDKLRQIINAKYEAGILKPYNYVSGYTRMQRFMETNISRPNIIRILEVLNTFRPTFRTIAQSLTDIDLLLVEEGFERLLLDYDNVFNSFGVPACLWRRTGEIYKANREFADLVGVPLSYFHEGKVCIYELMTESSTVNYWEKYGEIAFDATQKAVLTSCILQTAASVRTMVHNSTNKGLGDSRPMSSSSIALKIGNFMPIETQGQQQQLQQQQQQ